MAKRIQRIRNLMRNGDNGWVWEEADPDAEIRGHPKWIICHTSRSGYGLWRGGKQVMGTTQFELPKKKEKAYSKLYRLHKKDYWYV